MKIFPKKTLLRHTKPKNTTKISPSKLIRLGNEITQTAEGNSLKYSHSIELNGLQEWNR